MQQGLHSPTRPHTLGRQTTSLIGHHPEPWATVASRTAACNTVCALTYVGFGLYCCCERASHGGGGGLQRLT
jgi:hypothetical protein